MNWLMNLYKTYESASNLPLPIDKKVCPISHTKQNAHINIVIDGDGNFKRATAFSKSKEILLPATESSAGRSNGAAPHALADNLQYIAGDILEYNPSLTSHFDSYFVQLKNWNESPYGNMITNAVFKYVEKKSIIKDLINAGVLFVDDNGILLTSWDKTTMGDVPPIFTSCPKTDGITLQNKALVCWTIDTGVDDIDIKTWENQEIIKSWIEYEEANNDRPRGFCFGSGKDGVSLAKNHPKKIRHGGDGAKLISANDDTGFTYRGLFSDKSQVCNVGYDVSQKAHSALSWLIARQSFRNDSLTYLSWAVSGNDIPDPSVKAFSFDDLDDDIEDTDHTIDHTIDLGLVYAKKLKKFISGYSSNLEVNDQIILMGLNASSPGRMSIVYYREMYNHEFFSTIEKWYQDFSGVLVSNKSTKRTIVPYYGSPLPREIISTAYRGNESKDFKNGIFNNAYSRILPCIINNQPIPLDIVNACVKTAINRFTQKDTLQWEKDLGIACAVYKGYFARHPLTPKEYNMSLDTTYTSRDYLFGRLLAVADNIEQYALDIANEKRQTAASRLMRQFTNRPSDTWKSIDLALIPYQAKLQKTARAFVINRRNEIDNIMSMFDVNDFNSKTPLSGEFLLGYSSQRNKYREIRDAAKEERIKLNSVDTV